MEALESKQAAQEKRRDRLALLFLVIGTFLLFSPSLFSGFVYDDHHFVVNNPWIRSWDNFIPLVTTIEANSAHGFNAVFWRPLRNISFALDHSIFGLQPWGYHLVNILWHILAVAAVYTLLRAIRLPIAAAVIGTIAFAIHPAQVESVSWIKERDGVMAGAFLAWALVMAIRRTPLSAVGATVLFVLGMLAKENAVVFVPIFLGFLLLRWKDRSDSVTRLRDGALMAGATVLCIIFVWVRAIIVGQTAQLDGPHAGTWPATLITMLGMYARYVAIIFSGRGLFIDFSHIEPLPLTDPTVIAGVLLLVGTFAGIVFAIWRQWLIVGLTLGIFFAGLLPFLNIIPMMQWMAIRFLYVPMIGVAVGVGGLAAVLAERGIGSLNPRLVGMVLPAWLFIQGVLNIEQQIIWRSDVTLWAAAYRDLPTSVNVRQSYAAALLNIHDIETAWDVMQGFPLDHHTNRRPFAGYIAYGVISFRMGELEKAEEILRRSTILFSDRTEPFVFLGYTLMLMDRIDEAVVFWRQALEIDPFNRNAVGYLAEFSPDLAEREAMNQRYEMITTLPAQQWTL